MIPASYREQEPGRCCANCRDGFVANALTDDPSCSTGKWVNAHGLAGLLFCDEWQPREGE